MPIKHESSPAVGVHPAPTPIPLPDVGLRTPGMDAYDAGSVHSGSDSHMAAPVTPGLIEKLAKAAPHDGDVTKARAWWYKARIGLRKVSKTAVAIGDGKLDPKNDPESYADANTLLFEYCICAIDQDKVQLQGEVLMNKIMNKGSDVIDETVVLVGAAEVMKIIRVAITHVSDDAATAIENEIKSMTLSTFTKEYEVQAIATT